MTKICLLEQPGRRSPDSVIAPTVRRLGEFGCMVEVLVPVSVALLAEALVSAARSAVVPVSVVVPTAMSAVVLVVP